RPSLLIEGPATLRAVVRDQPLRTLIHVLNLNVERVSSFEDRVTPARDIRLICRVPFIKVRSVRALTADSEGSSGPLAFTVRRDGSEQIIETTLPKLHLASIVAIE